MAPVRLENGGYEMLVGAPNTQFDVRKWRRAFELTVHKLLSTPQDISATADRLRKLIAEKPPNYFIAITVASRTRWKQARGRHSCPPPLARM